MVVIAILILVPYSGYCQEKIFYEKIAFEFYKDSILNQSKDKIKLQKKLERGAFDPNWFPRCEKEIKLKEIDTVFDNRSNQFELPNITDNKFIKAYFNYATAFKELEILGADYFCQEEEFDNLTKEWVSNETEPITI